MRRCSFVVTALAIAGIAHAGGITSADSGRGERLFETYSCNQCHSINGKGGTLGPDLGKRLARDYTPAGMTALMWNHAPTMWATMKQQNIHTPPLTQQNAADLFAYFYSIHFFDKAADAGRGKQFFEAKHCAGCHSPEGAKTSGAKPINEWQALGNPIELYGAMWSHSTNMREAFAQRKIAWPAMTGQDLADMYLYARTMPGMRGKPVTFEASGQNGAALFASKCAGCHTGKLDLAARLKGQTLTDIAADMWSHAPAMADKAPKLEPAETQAILTYLWTDQVLQASGNAGAGKRVYDSSGCASCHASGTAGAPNLASRQGGYSSVSMVAALWQHGPEMASQIKGKNGEWPKFTGTQMADLIAYLNSGLK
jgi:mono/diheme cytochrome c family protein